MGTDLRIPLSSSADALLTVLRRMTRSPAIAALDGATLLGERAMMRGMAVPGLTSANGSCRLLQATGDRIAINLARGSDIEMLPALLECDACDVGDPVALAARVRATDAHTLTRRGRLLGLAVAREGEGSGDLLATAQRRDMVHELMHGVHKPAVRKSPRVLDLSALWAGPLAAHLLWLAGAAVIRVEHCRRPDAMRQGDADFFGLLNQGKASVALDFGVAEDQLALLSLIEASDIVIESARPRALYQLGIDAAALSRRIPGLVWMTITGHGACGEAADWVGFGDDCGVAGGLSAAFQAATGRAGFVGDAIADPLTGIAAAVASWTRWQSGCGGRLGVAMRDVVAQCLHTERATDTVAWEESLRTWGAARGQPFPVVQRRAITGPLAALGADTSRCVSLLSKSALHGA